MYIVYIVYVVYMRSKWSLDMLPPAASAYRRGHRDKVRAVILGIFDDVEGAKVLPSPATHAIWTGLKAGGNSVSDFLWRQKSEKRV